MKLTQKKVKELIYSITKEKNGMYARFIIACGRLNRDDLEIISKYSSLKGQLYAYKKILQIMQFKV